MSLPDSILAAELRAARPGASPELRARVLELAAHEPEPARRRVNLRRAAFVLAPAAIAAALGVALAGGVLGSSSSPTRHAVEGQRVLRAAANPQVQDKAYSSGAVAPSATRAQNYEAEMRLRVRDLSAATKRALRLTRGFGGYVRSVDYGSGAAAGTAELVVRIPIGSVQAAIVRFSALGTILDQHVSIRDAQPALDARFRQLQALRAEIARLQQRLADPKLTATGRKQLEAALARERGSLVALQRVQAQARKQVSFATVSVSLTSRKPAQALSHPGRIGRALHHARTILVKELVVLVYVAVVAVPLIAIALLLGGGERFRRRRATERLLASR